MRIGPCAFPALAVLLLPCAAFAQDDERREMLAAAEIAYPSSEVPALFSPGSASSIMSAEVENRPWSSDMEARILLQIDAAREAGLLLRRTDVECRATACAVLLVHAMPGAAVRDLTASLRETLGFAAVNTAEKILPLMKDGSARLILGYAEIVLMGDARAGARQPDG